MSETNELKAKYKCCGEETNGNAHLICPHSYIQAIAERDAKIAELQASKHCSHGVDHKEVLGHSLCVCCIHCQEENAALKEKLTQMSLDHNRAVFLLGTERDRFGKLESDLIAQIKKWRDPLRLDEYKGLLYSLEVKVAKQRDVIKRLVKALEVSVEASGNCSGGCCRGAKKALEAAKGLEK
jgi:hypothetical protein